MLTMQDERTCHSTEPQQLWWYVLHKTNWYLLVKVRWSVLQSSCACAIAISHRVFLTYLTTEEKEVEKIPTPITSFPF